MEKLVLLLFGFVIEAIILWQYTTNLLIEKRNTKERIFILFIFYLLLFGISLFQFVWINILCYLVINSFYIYSQFDLPFQGSMFHAFILTVMMVGTELFTFGIISRFAPHFLTDESIGLVVFTIFSKNMFLAVSSMISQIFSNNKKEPRMIINRGLFLIPLASIIVTITFALIGEYYVLLFPINLMLTISAFCLLIINLLVFGIEQYTQKTNAELAEAQLLLQKESDSVRYYEMLLTQKENQSIFIHDIKNHLHSIEILSQKQNAEDISSYIKELLNSPALNKSERICDHDMLNSILCRYQQECITRHIQFQADIRSHSVDSINSYDLTPLFCNLLDNAIEAAQGSSNSFIDLSVQKREENAYIVIVMINSCQQEPAFDTEGFPISNKPQKSRHGFGIKSIRRIIKKHRGETRMYYDKASATFHTILTLHV